MMKWVEVERVEKISPGFRVHMVERQRIVVALIDGELFAFSAICPHAGGPMHLAETDGVIVSCPLHSWRFDLTAGGRELHGYRALPMYDVKVEHGSIYVGLQDSILPPKGSE